MSSDTVTVCKDDTLSDTLWYGTLAQLACTAWWLKASVPYHKGRLEHTALFLILGVRCK